MPLSVVTPVPDWFSTPVPLMLFAKVMASLRLMVRMALFVTAPVPSWPIVPPLPTCSVPPLITVVPA